MLNHYFNGRENTQAIFISQKHWPVIWTCVLAPALMKPNIFVAGCAHMAVDLISCFRSELSYEYSMIV